MITESVHLDRLHKRFGLTPSEGRLAVHLAAGETLRMASSTLGITYETARAQLKAVFAKTGPNRQTELVVVILTTVIFTAPEATHGASRNHHAQLKRRIQQRSHKYRPPYPLPQLRNHTA